MRNIAVAACLAVGLLSQAGAVQAQVMTEGNYYVIEAAGGEKRIIGVVDKNVSIPVTMHQGGRQPHTCANGGYWESASGTLMVCGGTAEYNLVRPDADARMANGEPYPEGAFMMRRH